MIGTSSLPPTCQSYLLSLSPPHQRFPFCYVCVPSTNFLAPFIPLVFAPILLLRPHILYTHNPFSPFSSSSSPPYISSSRSPFKSRIYPFLPPLFSFSPLPTSYPTLCLPSYLFALYILLVLPLLFPPTLYLPSLFFSPLPTSPAPFLLL